LVFPGNNGNAFVKMKVELEGPIEKGRLIVFYEELDGNSRLIATGFVANTGVFIQEKKGQSFFVN
jgi:hypothetical protein